MGRVYLAKMAAFADRCHKSRAQPTCLYLGLEDARQAAQLFEREMKVISQARSPHILPLYDYGEAEVQWGDDDHLYGDTLSSRRSLLTWLRQRETSGALALQDVTISSGRRPAPCNTLHKHQVIHQDVKPIHFLIRVRQRSRTPKICY